MTILIQNSTTEKPEDVTISIRKTCPTCEGAGYVEVDMQLLDLVVKAPAECPDCHGECYSYSFMSLADLRSILSQTLCHQVR